jgi:mRNA interferase MazF
MPSLNGPATLIARHSTIAEAPLHPGDIVWVPFPFVEAPRLRDRPALVVSVQAPAPKIQLLWVLMITSAANKGWQGDVSLEARFAECGLNVPCVVRTAKITTVEAGRARKCGVLPPALWAEVRAELEHRLR